MQRKGQNRKGGGYERAGLRVDIVTFWQDLVIVVDLQFVDEQRLGDRERERWGRREKMERATKDGREIKRKGGNPTEERGGKK